MAIRKNYLGPDAFIPKTIGEVTNGEPLFASEVREKMAFDNETKKSTNELAAYTYDCSLVGRGFAILPITVPITDTTAEPVLPLGPVQGMVPITFEGFTLTAYTRNDGGIGLSAKAEKAILLDLAGNPIAPAVTSTTPEESPMFEDDETTGYTDSSTY